jgi:hypothetical protein
MAELKNKMQTNFSINKKVYCNFRDITKKHAINKSALIEKFMEEWVVKNNKEDYLLKK